MRSSVSMRSYVQLLQKKEFTKESISSLFSEFENTCTSCYVYRRLEKLSESV